MRERDEEHSERSKTRRKKRFARFALSSLEALLRIRKMNNEEVPAQDIVAAFNEMREHMLSNWEVPQDFGLGDVLAVGKEMEAGYQEIRERAEKSGWIPVGYDADRHTLIHEINELVEKAIPAPPQSSPPAGK